MPLSPPVDREHLHTRHYDMRGYRRADGLWDIEGHLTDTKTYGFSNDHRGEIEAEEPLHDMWIRLTIDEDFMIKDIEAVTEAGPYEACPAIAPNFAKVIGFRIGPGWRQKVRQQLGGTEGCTHLVEMLCAMATVAFQSLYPVLAKKDSLTRRKDRPGFIDSCHAFRSDGPVVKKAWPEFYTGGEN